MIAERHQEREPRPKRDIQAFQNLRVNLPAAFLHDRAEHECIIESASATSVSLISDVAPPLFESVVVYSELLGRLQCRVVGTHDAGFVAEIETTAAKRTKLANLLKWAATRISAGWRFHRVHERIAPKQPHASLHLPDGAILDCILRDVSRAGAAVVCEVTPEINSLVTLGSQRARVVRLIPDGFAVEFLRLVPIERFDENFSP